MRRLLTILFATMLSWQALAENFDFSAVCSSGQTLYYMITSDSTVWVTFPNDWNDFYGNYPKPTGALEIPNSVTNNEVEYAVTNISYYAFSDCGDLTSVTIPNTVTTIYWCAFFCCSGLTTVTIPNSLTSIGQDAFLGCNSLVYNEYDNACYLGNAENPYLLLKRAKSTGITSCAINENCKFIHSDAFSYCTSLTSLTVPESVSYIGDCAFCGCSDLIYKEYDNAYYLGNDENPYLWLFKAKSTEITSCAINDNCKIIYNSAFCNCAGLTSITIPNSVTIIGQDAFRGCTSLTSLTIGNSVTNIGYNAFGVCVGLTSVTIPNSVTSIDGEAFSACSGLTSVTIPKSVMYIGGLTFNGNNITIYCEFSSKPEGWNEGWNDGCIVIWANSNITAVAESADNAINIYAHGKTIVVENATDEIRVYDAMGKLVCKDVACCVRAAITVNTTGVYIVKTGNVVNRIVVN